MHTLGLVLVWIVAVAIVCIGIGSIAKSEANAAGFGLARLLEPDVRGWWQVKGVRDIVSGTLLIVAAGNKL